MPTSSANIRIRPIRFGFILDPTDRAALRQIFQLNTVLWGGVFNFIIPAFKRTPTRYRERFLKVAPARQFINGLLGAFQPDFVVETTPGLADSLEFDRKRLISIQQVTTRDDEGRCVYGTDIRTVCDGLYDEGFKFVQRHPPRVVLPHAAEQRYDELFAATFGEFPKSADLADCVEHYKGALDAKDETVEAVQFHRFFSPQYLYPLRVGRHALETRQVGWAPDPQLFYMDERSPYDLIEFWNLRAIGWHITPLPSSIAGKLKGFCEQFLADVYKPYPAPSNAFHEASFLCSRSCSMESLKDFVAGLKKPAKDAFTLDPRVPRLWEEWGRSADHAEPQIVTHELRSVEATVIGDSLHVHTAIPDFAQESRFTATENACANVLESVPGGAAVIPWQTADMGSLTGHFEDERIWLGREGIVTSAGRFSFSRFIRAPSPINVFSAFADGRKLSLEYSPAGRTCEQVILSLGGLDRIQLIASEDLLKLLDRLANGSVELEVPDEADPSKKRRQRLDSAPYSYVQEVLMRSNDGRAYAVANHLDALLRSNVLKLGMRLVCTECGQRAWYALEEVAPSIKCARCLRQFAFPAGKPPGDVWAYKTLGPFAVENFAHGSYCVAAALQFLSKHLAQSATWIPSFVLSGPDVGSLEADFGMFLRPSVFTHLRSPLLVLGECKTFGVFDGRDYRRARALSKLFPGSILCFATFRQELTRTEKRQIAAIVRAGRSQLRTGQLKNPVLVLTGKELLGQFKIGRLRKDYGDRSKHADSIFIRRDVQEFCDFTQQVHLGMESYFDWLDAKRQKRAAKLQARNAAAG